MRTNWNCWITTVALLVAGALSVSAQQPAPAPASPQAAQPSLADVARANKEAKKKAKKVYTEDDIPASAVVSTAAATGTGDAGSAASGAAQPDADKDAAGDKDKDKDKDKKDAAPAPANDRRSQLVQEIKDLKRYIEDDQQKLMDPNLTDQTRDVTQELLDRRRTHLKEAEDALTALDNAPKSAAPKPPGQ